MSFRTHPAVAKKGPFVVELEAGKTYYWCSCGHSENQPFCDGSHSKTEMMPVEFSVDETKKYGLCGCKHSKNQPFCDGGHKDL